MFFGTLLAGIGIIMFFTIPAGEEAANAATQNAAIGLGAAGTSVLGLSAIGRTFLKPETDYYDRLYLWLWITFLFILGATLCAAFNVDGAGVGLGITGGIFAIVTYCMADGVKTWYDHDPKTRDFHVSWRTSPNFLWNAWGIMFNKDTGLKGADKPSNYDDQRQQARDARLSLLDQGFEYLPLESGIDTRSPKQQRIEDGRRLASTAINGSSIVSTLAVTLASLLVWYLFFRGQSSQDKPRRRTTIMKKRPTFVKGKRRVSHKPTLSTLRSEGNLMAN